jgi:hypothetical protein
MYMTHQERLEAARMAWEMSQDQQMRLSRKIDYLKRREGQSKSNVDACILAAEIALLQCQHTAVVENTNDLWDTFMAITERYAQS